MPIRPENRDRYPANWPDISRTIRFARAQGRCECVGECGRGTHQGRCPNGHLGTAYDTGSRVILTTAHLDHTPENCDPANLRAMCNGCHLHYDRDHHRQTAANTRRTAIEAAGQLALESPVTSLTPNPSSPFATAAPDVRHMFPTLTFFGDPKPGALVLTGCDQLAVVPTEPLTDAYSTDVLPDGLCPACVAGMNGDDEAGPEQPATGCSECGINTRHNGMCALCRQEAHDEWWAQQQPARAGEQQ